MAIISPVHKVQHLLKGEAFAPIFDYFHQALDETSAVHARIFSLPIGSFEKVPLTHGIFALEQVFYTKDRELCFIESHKNYVDFQLVLFGKEQMEYADIDTLCVQSPYDAEKDLIVYTMTDKTSKFLLQKGDLAIFFPEDGHIGLPQFQESECVYKTVIKAPISLFEGVL